MEVDTHQISDKDSIQEAIQDAANRLSHQRIKQNSVELYLTKKQYNRDSAAWRAVLRQYGLPGDAIVIVPEVLSDS